MIGATLGHYLVRSKVGEGGMGEVYRATDTRLGRDVALKVLPAALTHDLEMVERFRREARAVAALNHPHIVTIYSVEETDGVHFLTMELVDGQSLDRHLAKGTMEVGRILDIATALAGALAAAHDKGVVHRDLKPANVMVTREGGIKVLDFGLAMFHNPAEGTDSTANAETAMHTSAGVVMGTGPYMSPEQAQGRRVDPRTDIFSLGVVLYEMTTGRRPFGGGSAAGVFAAILRDQVPRVTDERPEVPAALADVIARCLEKDADLRFQSARDVASAVRDLRTSAPGSGTPSPAPSAGVRPGAARADEGFWVAVLPFKYTGPNADLTALAEGLSGEIVTGLSRFSYLKVIARGSTERYANQVVDVRTAGKELGARYVLEGTLRQAGTKLRLAVELVDAMSGAHLWAESYERPFTPDAVFELQDDLVPRIVSTIADTHGVLPRSMAGELRSRPPGDLTPYEAVLRSFGYFERVTAEELATARRGLESAVQKAPAYADAWAMLALLSGQEYGQGFNLQTDPLTSGAAAARRAIEAGPSNHLAYFSLAQVLFFQKEFEAFRNAAARAASLNPMDGNSLAFLGEMLTYVGDADRGLELAARAKQLNPHHPGWYWYADVFDAYRRRDYPAALEFALNVNMPQHWGLHAAMGAVCGQLGKREAGGKAVANLLRLRPDIAATIRDELAKWFDPAYIEHLIDGLRKAGLDVPEASGVVATSTAAIAPSAPGSGAARADEGFWVAVLPFKYTGPNADLTALAEGLSEELVTGMSRFSYLKVIARKSTERYANQAGNIGTVGREIGARYVMEGSLRQAASVLRVAVQLVDAGTGAHLWADTYDRAFSPESVFELQDDLVPRIVSTVADMHGVLPRRMSEAVRLKPADQLSPYEALLHSFGYNERFTPEALAEARTCLERAVQRDPSNADCWAMLSLMYSNEYGHWDIQDPESSEKALRAARTAVLAAPLHSLPHYALAQALFFRREFPAARTAAERAVSQNPMDGATAGFMGLLIAYSGDWERGCALAAKAFQLNPTLPGMYHYTAWHEAYGRKDYRAALDLALKLNTPDSFYQHAVLAMCYAQLGEMDAARRALGDMLAIKPDYAEVARHLHGKWIQPDLVEQLMDGLRKAGLDVPE